MEKEEKTFDLTIVWKAFRRFWLWVLIATVVIAGLTAVATYIYDKANPSYVAKTQYLVLAGNATTGDYNSNRLARDRAEDVAKIIQTGDAAVFVLEKAGQDTNTWARVQKMMSVSVSNDTSVLSVTVRGENSEDVRELANALEMYLPTHVENTLRQDGTRLVVIDKAFHTADAQPTREGAHLMRNTAVGALFALVVSVLVAVLVQINDRTIYNADTLKAAFETTPLLGSIPVWDNGSGSGKKVDPNGEAHDYLGKRLTEKSPFNIAEAYRSLRTNLCYAVPARENGLVFGVTSARNGEGKTLTAANLAVSFAGLSKKVLLIESDMRMPTLGRLFGYVAEHGLADLLAGMETDYRRCLVKVEDTAGLEILPVGALPPNPQELLASDAMKQLLQTLRDTYDVIIMDLPPVGVVSDAGVLAGLVDRYIMVARSNFSDTSEIEAMLGEMDKTSMHGAGFVLTDVPIKRSSYYYDKKKSAETV